MSNPFPPYDAPPHLETKPGYGFTEVNTKLSPERRQIKAMKPKYEQILIWLIENPAAPIRDCAEYFGVTSQWLRIIINSDAFRARLAERQDEVFHTCVADLRDKTHAAAHEALDLFMDKIHVIEDPMKLLKAVDTLFERLGYTNKANIGSPTHYTQNNTTVVVGSNELQQARALMDQALAMRTPRPEDPQELPAQELPAAGAAPPQLEADTPPSPPGEPRSGEPKSSSDED